MELQSPDTEVQSPVTEFGISISISNGRIYCCGLRTVTGNIKAELNSGEGNNRLQGSINSKE